MPQIAINKVSHPEESSLPSWQGLAKKVASIRERAFELFEKRGHQPGHDIDDWLAAEQEFMASPAAELTEVDGVYKVEMKLPGFIPKELHVTATPHEVIVRAASEAEHSNKRGRIIWSEFAANDIYRCIAVPTAINVDQVTAKLEKGVLHITAPKSMASVPVK